MQQATAASQPRTLAILVRRSDRYGAELNANFATALVAVAVEPLVQHAVWR